MIKKIVMLNDLTEDMVSDGNYEYLQSITNLPSKQIQAMVQQLDFSEFLELQIALEKMDRDKLIQLLDIGHHVSESAGDNPFSSVRPGGSTGQSSSSAMSGYYKADNELDRAMSGLPKMKKTNVPKGIDTLKNPSSPDIQTSTRDEILGMEPGTKIRIDYRDQEYDAIIKNHEPGGSIVIIGDKEYEVPNGVEGLEVTELTDESADISRLQLLAGIEETSSGGASSAGGIASMASSIGSMQKRDIYTPKKIKKKSRKE